MSNKLISQNIVYVCMQTAQVMRVLCSKARSHPLISQQYSLSAVKRYNFESNEAAVSSISRAWRQYKLLSSVRDLREHVPWILDWSFKQVTYSRLLPTMYTHTTFDYVASFLTILAKFDPRCPTDAGTLVKGCAIVMCQPEINLWCPSCVVFTRFILLLLDPTNATHQNRFVSSLLALQDCFDHQTVRKSWDLDMLCAVSFDDRLRVIPNKIWGVSTDYSNAIDAIKPLAIPFDKPINRLDRARSFYQLLQSKIPAKPAGPLTIEGSDLELMIYVYGDQYLCYGKLYSLINEEFALSDKWIPKLKEFAQDISQKIGQMLPETFTDTAADTQWSQKLDRLSGGVVDKVISHIAQTSKSMCIIRAIKTLGSYDKRMVLTILNIIQQYYLELVMQFPVPKFDWSREISQMASDMMRGGNLALISMIDNIIRSRENIGRVHGARRLCAVYTAQICQLPSPEFIRWLPDPVAQMSLEILRESCRLRVLVFTGLLLEDFEQLGIDQTEKLQKALSKALSTLPLYLETKGIIEVTEKICMVASRFAPIDFDQLDVVYDKVIYLLVRDDERINRILRNLQDFILEMFDPESPGLIEKAKTYVNFMPVVERLYNIVVMVLGVYSPIFEAIYDQPNGPQSDTGCTSQHTDHQRVAGV